MAQSSPCMPVKLFVQLSFIYFIKHEIDTGVNRWISEKINFNNCIICQNLKNHIMFIQNKTNENKINNYLEKTHVAPETRHKRGSPPHMCPF